MKPGKSFKRWWQRVGMCSARIFVVQYVAEQAFRAGYRLGRKAHKH